MNHKTMIKSAAVLGILLAALSSCTEQLSGPEADAREKKVQTIQGVICDAPGDGTRASIDGDTGVFSWVAGDVIAVYSSNGTYYDMPIQSGSGTDTGSFSAEFDGSLTGYAVYPYDIKDASASSASSVSVTLPDRYGFDNSRTDYATYYRTYARMPMVAKCASTCDFYHVGGLLRLTLQWVPANTSYLTVETDCPITGSFTVSDPASTTPSISTAAGEGDPVYFNLTKVLTSKTSGIVLNVPVPVGTYSRIKVSAYNARHMWLGSAINEVTRSVERAHGKKVTMKFGDVTGAFAGLVLAPGDLYRDSGKLKIAPRWDTFSPLLSFNDATQARYFNWSYLWSSVLTMGRFGASSGLAESSTGSIDLPIGGSGPSYTWRLPTQDEWNAIIGTSRTGSTVNNVAGWHYAFIRFENNSRYSGTTQPLGLLLFPDGVTMSPSYTLPYHDDKTAAGINTNITVSQLNEYLDAGCVFLPCAGYGSSETSSLSNTGTIGRYWSGNTASSTSYALNIKIEEGRLAISSDYKSWSYSVRLVREP